MKLIGKLICSLRARFGARPVHRYVRRNDHNHVEGDVAIYGPRRVCTRCGHTVPVKPRKRKATV